MGFGCKEDVPDPDRVIEQEQRAAVSGSRACEAGARRASRSCEDSPNIEGLEQLVDDEEEGKATKVRGVVESKLHRQRPFAL